MRPKLRTVFVGGLVSGALSVVLAPKLGGVRRGPLARFGPLAAADRHTLAAFAGTPCALEERADRPLGPAAQSHDE